MRSHQMSAEAFLRARNARRGLEFLLRLGQSRSRHWHTQSPEGLYRHAALQFNGVMKEAGVDYTEYDATHHGDLHDPARLGQRGL